MPYTSRVTPLLVLLCLLSLVSLNAHGSEKVIYETDMTFDVDDAGALAVLHALADLGEAEILLISYNEIHPYGPIYIQSVNDWYGRRSIPIGRFVGTLDSPDESRYLEKAAAERSSHGRSFESSLVLYPQVLQEQPNNSVTIISVGFLNNLVLLLRDHKELVQRKVKELVLMGGLRNDAFNFVRHNLEDATEEVITEWPTELVVIDFGAEVQTGSELKNVHEQNPIRKAYFHWFNGELRDRPSWDQVAVLYGIRGTKTHFTHQTSGEGKLRSGFTWSLSSSDRKYAKPSQSESELKRVIEELMVAPPKYGELNH